MRTETVVHGGVLSDRQRHQILVCHHADRDDLACCGGDGEGGERVEEENEACVGPGDYGGLGAAPVGAGELREGDAPGREGYEGVGVVERGLG